MSLQVGAGPDKDRVIRAAGIFPTLTVGNTYALILKCVTHPIYGDQYQASEVIPVLPTDEAALTAFLQTLPGLGPKRVARLLAAWGVEGTIDVLETPITAAARIQKLLGLSSKTALSVCAAWCRQSEERATLTLLMGWGLNVRQSTLAGQRWGSATTSLLREHPYRLAEIPGVGFAVADGVGRHQGVATDDAERVWAGISHILQQEASEGHCWTAWETVLTHGPALLTLPPSDLTRIRLSGARPDGPVVIRGEYAALRQLAEAEVVVAAGLRRLRSAPPLAVAAWDWDTVWAAAPVPLDSAQRLAVQRLAAGRLVVLNGGPGTGKTSVLRSVLDAWEAHGVVDIALCAPTGKAARRLGETTGRSAQTLHRWLGLVRDRSHDRRAEVSTWQEALPVEQASFHGWLIIDETSMLDTIVFARVLQVLAADAGLILVGDSGQLASVGPGAVLQDCLDGGVPCETLRTIYRQAAGSTIVRVAHDIRAGRLPQWNNDPATDNSFWFEIAEGSALENEVVQLVTRKIPARFGIPSDQIQVLVPMYQGSAGIHHLNSRLQAILNPPGERAECRWQEGRLREGDRLIWTKNDYQRNLMNGEELVVVSLTETETPRPMVTLQPEEGEPLTMPLTRLEAQLAYAISVHKAQGSEYPAVVVVCHNGHGRMLARPLLYTAATRAQRLCVLVGQRKALSSAVQRVVAPRRTGLVVLLSEPASPAVPESEASRAGMTVMGSCLTDKETYDESY